RTRLFGATGTVLMAIGSLGAGARPVVQDPTFGVRLLNLPSRMQTVSLTMTTTGAVMMALAWLMLGRFALGKRRMSRSQLDRTLMLWILPLLIAPPMYSKDVYSYLAQSEISRLGLDPYKVGPGPALGLDHVFTLSVPSLWRDTPAPYGPLFIWIGRGISSLTGENIVAAVLCHRLVVLVGVGLIVWATPRLARRCGVAEVSALWLGATNPLLIMHLVAGIHNEALMLGLMLAGTEFALRGVDSTRPLLTRPLQWPRSRADWHDGYPLAMLVLGVVLITMSSQVKLPSLLALGFVAMALARRWGGNVRGVVAAGGFLGLLSLGVMALIGSASGLGFGWVSTLGTANVVRSWMSPPTLLALGTGQVGILLGLGDHTTAVLGLTRAIGVLIIAILVSWLLIAVLRGRLHPVGGLGVALGATVLLFPVVQPWYLLWAIIPLAAWATRPRFRIATIVVTLVVGIFGPTANGDRFALFQIVDATVASTVIVLIIIALTYSMLPWRSVPHPIAVSEEAAQPDVPAPASTATPATTPALDAYAESP
ncbi:MAG: polyprenol phosphomannose-dependent alpha 1,6 mannosyltransferase MptB, partial [Mycobacterium sp.]